jgi:hypothetical protein
MLEGLSLVPTPNVQPDGGKGKPYRIPDGFPQIRSYPRFVSEEFPYSISEQSIPRLLEIENDRECGYKAFPRIVPPSAVYGRTDQILSLLEPLRQDSFGWSPAFLDERESMGENYLFDLWWSITEIFQRELQAIHNSKYVHMIVDDLSPGELADMNFDLDYLPKQDFRKNVQELYEDYRLLRNRKDFEVSYKRMFINKYARRLFHEEGYLQEAEREMAMLAEMAPELEESEEPVATEVAATEPAQQSPDAPKTQVSEGLVTLVRAFEEDHPSLKDKENVFMKFGHNWYVKFKGKAASVRDTKGARTVARLMGTPNRGIQNVVLVADESEDAQRMARVQSSRIDNLRAEQKMDIRKAVHQLLAKKKEAIMAQDESSALEIDEMIQRTVDKLEQEYDAKLAIRETKGKYSVEIIAREKILTAEAERARKAIGKQLGDFFVSVGKELSEFELYLRQVINTKATVAVFEPQKSQTDKSIKWYISW